LPVTPLVDGPSCGSQMEVLGLEKAFDVLEGLCDGCTPLCPIGQPVLAGKAASVSGVGHTCTRQTTP
jgi:hypothetical protein